MLIDEQFLNMVSAQAKVSPRLRMNYDLRNSPEDKSQRMLSAIEPGTQVPIHRHRHTSETVVCVRGHFKQCMYNDEGVMTEEIDMVPGGNIVNVPVGQWHNILSLESGTVLFEAKDGPYQPLDPDDIMEV